MHPSSDSLRGRLTPPVSAITAYDYPSARICDEAGVQLILVGDSLGMVVAGQEDTTGVTLEQMLHHTAMVRRGVQQALVVADLPIRTYETPAQTVASSRRLLEAGADAVKLEGAAGQLPKIHALRDEGIAVCAHLGMLPQRVREEGGYRKKGRTRTEAARLVDDALALEEAGAFAMVLESVVPSVAEEITARVEIPTIGIGSGGGCDGQIRVLHDVTGAFPWFVPPFAKVYGDVAGVMRSSVEAYLRDLGAEP